MEPLVEHRLELAGRDTRLLELEGGGAPIVFFHGFADSADTWRTALDGLARTGRRAIAIDLPGFGTSAPLEPGPILPQLDQVGAAAVEYAADGGGPVIAAGNSLGGCVALRLAERADLPLVGIVPVAPAGLDMARWFVLLERDPIVRTILSSPIPLPGWVVRAAVSELYRRFAFARPGEIDAKVVATFASHFSDRAAAARQLATGGRLLPELRDPFHLDRLGCPVLLVWGRNDLLVFPTGARRVLDASPAGSRLEMIEDCGHCPQIEAPERFVELLLEFPEQAAKAA
jgi:pimeloyl-ACP methyl ester carboxylesterase